MPEPLFHYTCAAHDVLSVLYERGSRHIYDLTITEAT